MATERLIRSGEAGEILGVSPVTAAKWAKQGKIPHRLSPKGQVLFRRRDLEQYLVQLQADREKREEQRQKREALLAHGTPTEKLHRAQEGRGFLLDLSFDELTKRLKKHTYLEWVIRIGDVRSHDSGTINELVAIDTDNGYLEFRDENRQYRVVRLSRVYKVR